MRKTSLLAVAAILAVVHFEIGKSNAQQAELDLRISELRQQREKLLAEQHQVVIQQLGNRFQPLMAYTVDELRLALELRVKQTFEGASIMSADDPPEFLGKVADSLARDSIFNDIGPYGSNISPKSIWNNIGKYGSTISNTSAFNSIASRPPFIVKDNKVIGRLTVNRFVVGAVDPALLKMCFSF